MLDRGIKHKLSERGGALRTVECLQGRHVPWYRLCTVQVQTAPFTETTVEPSISKTCFSASLISPKALAAWLGISKVEAETEKGEGEFPHFATGCQALSADPRAQWLKVFFFFFFLPLTTLWMDLEGTRLSEISQTEKDKYLMLSLIFGI